MEEMRDTKEQIFDHLRDLLGDGAVVVSKEVASRYIAGEQEISLKLLKEYDASIGGIGIYRGGGKKLPEIYRALSYDEIPMIHGHAHEDGRFMIDSSCGYLEELIKKMVRLSIWEKFKDSTANRLPLGTLARKLQKHVPNNIYKELIWLNDSVYVFAKHHYNLEREREDENEPDHYFELEEAIAIYLFVRVLGKQLEELSGKSQEIFLEGWALNNEEGV